MNTLRKRIINIQNTKLLNVSVGKSTGSIVLLDFGHQKNKIEFSLIIYCAWRLDCKINNSVITGWNESSDLKTGNLAIQLKKLENDIVRELVINDFGDINICFQSQKILRVFCDITPNIIEEGCLEENWGFSIHKENLCYTHNQDFSISVSKYDPSL